MVTDLILQSTNNINILASELATLTGATSIRETSSNHYRLHQVHDTAALRQKISVRCEEALTDHAWMPSGQRLSDYRLLAMDMDSTLINIECIDEIADMCGLKKEVSAITEAAMRGEIKDFSESLTRRVALLKGLDASALQRVYDERLQLSPGAEILVQAAHHAGLQTLLVSGGFTFFTERVKNRLGLTWAYSNTLEIVNGKLTGMVIGNIVDAEEKARRLLAACEEIGCAPSQTIAIGDGANDLKMMAGAGLSVAYHAKPVVREQAGQAVRFGGLDVVLGWLG